jgi:hypothetical protein
VFPSKCISTAALLLAGWLSLAGAASAQKNADSPAEKADEAAIHDYVLTMPKIQVYAAAMKDYQAAEKDPGIQAEAKRLESDDKASMLEKVRMVETSCPHINAWLKAHNLNAREFMLLPMTLMTTGLGEVAKKQGGKPPDFVNPVNLAFYEQHKAEIDKMDLKPPGGDNEQ